MITKSNNYRATTYVTTLMVSVIIPIILISPSSAAHEIPKVASDTSQYVTGSLCKQPDQIVFSCPLAKSGKIVSVCAAGNTSPHTFYYVFGRPNAIEMRYPDNSSGPGDSLSHSYLGYSGGTAGYAYSFVRNEIKYIVYYLSGKYQYTVGGVIVQQVKSVNALVDMECSKGKINAISNKAMFEETSKWKNDKDLEIHGLPLTK